MWEKGIIFLAGVAVGTFARPILRETIKGGILVSNYVQQVAVEARESIEDLTAEAVAEIETKKNRKLQSGV